jgi:hypothetical protein
MIIAIIIARYDDDVNILYLFPHIASRGEPSRPVRLSPASALLVRSPLPTAELDANTIYRRVSLRILLFLQEKMG